MMADLEVHSPTHAAIVTLLLKRAVLIQVELFCSPIRGTYVEVSIVFFQYADSTSSMNKISIRPPNSYHNFLLV